MNITDKDIEIYRRDGVVKLSGVFDLKWVDFMRQATEECMNKPSEMAEEYADSKKSTRFFGDQFLWTYNDKFKKFIMESEAAKIAATTVDKYLKELTEVALEHDYEIIVIADHGKSDYMVNDDG